MLTLSPLKILIVIVVALLVVGPDKLPQVARQIGGAWKTFRGFTSRVEDEVRSSMPDLPSTGDIARFARSPVALLDSLAKMENTELEVDPGADVQSHDDHLVADPGAPPTDAQTRAANSQNRSDETGTGSLTSETSPATTPRSTPPTPHGGDIDPSLN